MFEQAHKLTFRNKLIFVGLIVVYRLVLDLFFIQFSADFDYYGLIYLPRTPIEILGGWLAILLTAYTIDYSTKRPSNSVHLMLYLFCFVPSSVHYTLNLNHSAIFFYGLFGFFMIVPLIRQPLSSIRKLKLPSLRTTQFNRFLMLTFTLFLGIVVYSYGLSFNVSSLTDVYDQRTAFKETSGRGTKYIVEWLANGINVALVLYSLISRKYLISLFSLALSIYLFSLGGHKSFLFVAPFAAVLYFLVKIFREDFNRAVVIGLVTAVVLLWIYDFAGEKEYSTISSLFIRRTLLLPSQIYYHYCDYFSINYLNFFSHNFPFRFFMDSPYSEKIPDIIGSQYFRFKEDVYANGNVFADTFSNLGLFSYPFLAIVLPVLYSIIDWAAANKHLAFSLPLIFMTSHTLLNSGLIVTLVTHGLLIGILVLAFYPRNLWQLSNTEKETKSNEQE